jgi:hypothetical protein
MRDELKQLTERTEDNPKTPKPRRNEIKFDYNRRVNYNIINGARKNCLFDQEPQVSQVDGAEASFSLLS